MKVSDYRRPQFPQVRSAAARRLADEFERAHEALSKNINVNPIAVPRHLAEAQKVPALRAAQAIEAALARAAAARAERERLLSSPAQIQADPGATAALQLALAYAAGDPAKMAALVAKIVTPSSPRELAIAQAALETGVPF